MLKGRHNLYDEITDEVLALAKPLKVLVPEPLVTTVLTRSLAPTLENPLLIFVSNVACPGISEICLCRGGLKDSSYNRYDQTKPIYCATNPCLYSSLPR